MASLKRFLDVRGGTFQVICGSDAILLDALDAGAVGGVSGTANVFPELMVSLYTAFAEGQYDLARARQAHLMQLLTLLNGPEALSLLKHGLTYRGLIGGRVRAPLLEASSAAVTALLEAMTPLIEG